MEVALLLLILGIIIMRRQSIAAWGRRILKLTAGPDDEIDREPEPFRILALGQAGAGKTVFLACAYENMLLPRPLEKRTFYMKADDATSSELLAVHQAVIDASAEWPAGTDPSTLRTHVFDVMMRDEGRNPHRLVQIEYLDYAGELLGRASGAGTKRQGELRDYFEKSNAIFVFLDGHKMAEYIRGEPGGLAYFNGRILTTIKWVMEARCPIHFVLTKWDLLRDIGEDNPDDPDSRLAVVRRELERLENFRDLLAAFDLNRVRIIPISAVGEGFAKIGSDNRVKKIVGAKPRPINIAMPFIAAIPDFLSYAQSRLDEGEIHRLRETMDGCARESSTSRLRMSWEATRRLAPLLPKA